MKADLSLYQSLDFVLTCLCSRSINIYENIVGKAEKSSEQEISPLPTVYSTLSEKQNSTIKNPF